MLVTDPICGDCGRGPRKDRSGDAFVEMSPGRDGKPWHLCPRCYNDGRLVRVRSPTPKEPTMISGEMASALVNSGWEKKDNGDGTVTITPPDRPAAPRRRRA